jgi:hypothetical protein
MDNKDCLAIVPYEPKKQKPKIAEEYFSERKTAYIFFILLNTTMIFIGFCISKRYGNETVKDGLFSFIINKTYQHLYDSVGIRFLFGMTLTMYISAFTIFCPAVSATVAAYIALKAGLFLSKNESFLMSLLLIIFVFASMLYESEICCCYRKAKYGVRQIFKPQNVITLSIKTIIFVIIIMLYGAAVNAAV